MYEAPTIGRDQNTNHHISSLRLVLPVVQGTDLCRQLALQSLATSAYVLGIIMICVTGVSFLAAAFYLLMWLCHRGGKHVAAFALPFS